MQDENTLTMTGGHIGNSCAVVKKVAMPQF